MSEDRHTNLPDEIDGERDNNEVSWWLWAFIALVVLYFGGHLVLYWLGIPVPQL